MKGPVISKLGKDPNRTHRINANSFQQYAITTNLGWQYAGFYTSKHQGEKGGPTLVNLTRRRVDNSAGDKQGQSSWQTITFEDYEQTVDDGHNVISLGVCKGDGTVHMSYDHHCDPLKFRISQRGVATNTSEDWNVSLFSDTQANLPGIAFHENFKEVTYPCFVNVGNDLIFMHRIGQAGLGSNVLYHYSSTTHAYTYLGNLLTGVSNSPCINGIDYRLNRLHISFCYRAFIAYEGVGEAGTTAHKAQAGPNGPENNEGLYYIYSDDNGTTWLTTAGNIAATVSRGTVLPSTEGIMVFDIPKNSGILNQEGQVADWKGGFHVLNRENGSGKEEWIHYYLNPNGAWSRGAIPAPSGPTEVGPRGSLCVDRANTLYAVLQGNMDSSLSILLATKESGYEQWKTVWTGKGYDGEPLVDLHRLEDSGTLSVFTRTDGSENEEGIRDVVVLDFEVGEH